MLSRIIKSVGSAPAPLEPDPFWSQTRALLYMNHPPFPQYPPDAFVDEKNNTVTNVGSIGYDSVNKKFGSASGLFGNPSTNSYLSLPIGSAIGTGNFTIEFFAYQTANVSNVLFSIGGGWNTSGHIYCLSYGGKFALSVGNVWSNQIGVSVTNTWRHFALVRNGTAVTMYIGGVSVGGITSSNNITQTTMYIGGVPAYVGGYTRFYGNIDDYRLTAYARYTSNFTPPVIQFSNF